MPRGWVARIELERVLFPLEKAKVWASSEPKSRGALGATRRHVSGGFSLGMQVTGRYVRAPPPRGYQTAPRFALTTGVTEAKRGVGRLVSPRDQGYRRRHVSLRRPGLPKRNVASDATFRLATRVTEGKRGVELHRPANRWRWLASTFPRRLWLAKARGIVRRRHVSWSTLVSQGAWCHPTPRFLVDPG